MKILQKIGGEINGRKENCKDKFINIFLILAIIVIIIMAVMIYKISNDKLEAKKEVSNLNNKISTLESSSAVLQSKIDSISNTLSSNSDAKDSSISLDKKYNNSDYNISFSYPSNFKLTEDTFKTSAFEAMTDNNENRFQISIMTLGDELTLLDFVNEEENLKIPDGSNFRNIIAQEEYITLNTGIKGYQFESTNRDNSYQIIFITQKDNKAYEFVATINKNDYEQNKEIINKMLNTLKL